MYHRKLVSVSWKPKPNIEAGRAILDIPLGGRRMMYILTFISNAYCALPSFRGKPMYHHPLIAFA